jgi:ornithine carbamoyltransferase
MGQESEMKRREKAFKGFEVTTTMMNFADPHAIFMHCMPAHRGSEVSADVIDGKQSVIFQQAHNRMHAARAVLAYVMGVRP